jgi:hypothetical protein
MVWRGSFRNAKSPAAHYRRARLAATLKSPPGFPLPISLMKSFREKPGR